MSVTVASLLESAKTLNRESQMQLVEEIESLWYDEGEMTDEEVDELRNDPEFLAELERRSEEHRKDPSSGIMWSDLKAKLLRMLPDE